jgi:putative peptidoglycan lipid II flippase
MSDEPMSEEILEKRDLMKDSGKLSALTLISRVLGLIRDLTRGALLGTGGLGDAFTVAYNIPNLFRKLFAEGSTSAAFIPTFKGYLKEGNPLETREFLSAIFTVLSVLLVVFTAAGMLLSDFAVLLFHSDPVETSILTRMMFPFLALVSFAALFQGMLNSVNIFTPTGIAPILFNLCFIFLPMALTPILPNPARAMAVAVTVGGLIQALCQLPAVFKTGFRFGFMNPVRAFRHPGTRKVMRLIAPTILGMAAYQLNSAVSISLASGVGAATALNFSLRLQELVLGVFVASIATVVLPILSAQVKAGDWKSFNERLMKSLDAVSLFTLPVAVFCMLDGHDIVALLFKIRAFGEESVKLTVGAFFFHMSGLFFIGQYRILASAFYARENPRSPTIAGIASVGVNILCAWLLSYPLKGSGVALALSIASAVNFGILAILLLRKKETDRRAFLASCLYALRMLLYSAAAGLPVFFLNKPVHAFFSFSTNRFIAYGAPLVTLALVFGAVGIFLLVLTKDPNLKALTDRFARKKAA